MHDDHEIPSAFLIRALARGESHHCDRCGGRMFVRSPSGLCPFCACGRELRADRGAARPLADEPFVPRLGEQANAGGRWHRPGLRARRERRRAGSGLRDLAPNPPHPTTS